MLFTGVTDPSSLDHQGENVSASKWAWGILTGMQSGAGLMLTTTSIGKS